MTDVKQIDITHEGKVSTYLLKQIIFWGGVISTQGFTRLWFGGSFITDAASVFLAAIMLLALYGRGVGLSISVTQKELVAWARDGAPTDMKAWLLTHRK